MTNFRSIIIILCISLLPFVIPLFRSDLALTHDGNVHLAKMVEYYKMLRDGQFPVRWASDFSYGYGLPTFNFSYPLPYAVAAGLLYTGIGLVPTFKLTFLLSFLLSGLFMFLFTSSLFKNWKSALLATILYQFSPFHLEDIFTRGALGESYTYTLLPLILLGISLLIKKQNLKYYFLSAFATFLLIISHNSVSLLFFGLSALYLFFFARSYKVLLIGSSAMVLGLACASFYWVPALTELKYTYSSVLMKNYYITHFPSLRSIFLPSFSPDVSSLTDGISTQIGFWGELLPFIAGALLARSYFNEENRRILIFSTLTFAGGLFFMLPMSAGLWSQIPVMEQFQFPWRFLTLIIFSTALIGGEVAKLKMFNKSYVFILLIISIIASSTFFWFSRQGYSSISDSAYWNYHDKGTSLNELDIIWSAGASSFPKTRVETISGTASISDFKNSSTSQSFFVKSETAVKMVDHINYFPGWRVFNNGRKIDDIQFQDPNWRGQIEFDLPSGSNKVEVIFGKTRERLLAEITSLVAGIILATMLITIVITRFTGLPKNKKLVKQNHQQVVIR